MGRPLNKKYFGLTNSVPPAGAEIGGEGIASITITAGGTYINRLPTVSFATPSFPLGQQAVGVLYSTAKSATLSAKGSGYQIGDILTDTNGTTYRVTKLRVLSASLNTAGSSTTWDGTEWIVWDQFINSHWTSPTILKGVTADGGHHLTGYNAGASIYGVWDGTDGTHAPTTAQTIIGGPTAGSMTPTGYNTRATGDYNGSGVGDNNGTGGSVTFTYGVEAVTVVASGSFSGTINFGALTTTVAPTGGSGATLTVSYQADHAVITTAGDGYLGSESMTFTAPGGGETVATGTYALTNLYNNAIVGIDLATSLVIDIVKQESNNSFYVFGTQDYPYILGLAPPTSSSGLYIQATDSTGNSYWVKKIMSHKAVVGQVGSGSFEFAEDEIVLWSFDAAIAGVAVSIRNGS